jgi:hypothetical protein
MLFGFNFKIISIQVNIFYIVSIQLSNNVVRPIVERKWIQHFEFFE